MTSYAPVKLAFKIFEPITGTDETLSPIIFIHGITASIEYWENIPQRIADATKRRAYAYDARNHGESDYSEHFSFNLNVEDLLHFMNGHNIPKAILIGHSMGGCTATYAALKKPERVEKVFVEDMYVKRIPQALLDGGLPIFYMRKESVLHMPKEISIKEAVEFSNEFIISKIPKGSPLQERLDDIRKSRVNLKRKPDGSLDLNYNSDVLTRALKNSETLLSEPKGQYDGPAFFIYGPLSPMAVHTEEETIRKHLPKAKFIEVPGAGHNIHVDFPEEFVSLVLQHL